MNQHLSEIDPFDAIIELFHTRTGIIYPATRRHDAVTGIHDAMTQTGISDPRHFLRQISIDKELFSRLVEHLAIAETYFFREIAQFNEIRNRIIPELRALRGPDFTLRAWSAGCSTGEEAYSLTILFEQEAIPAQVLATDISPKALAKAKLGNYGAWSLRGEGRQAASYVGATSPRVAIPDRLRARVNFRQLNLISDAYPSPASATTDLDLILCRNVLIYFDDEAIRDVAKRLSMCLARGGWLITGPSDPPLWDYIELEPVITPAGILYRHTPNRSGASANRQFGTTGHAAIRPTSPKKTKRVLRPNVLIPGQIRRASSEETKHESSIAISHIRDLADHGDISGAITASEAAIAADPTTPELQYLRAIALLAQDRKEEAYEALRRVLYLDRSLAVAHFAMGSLLTRRRDFPKARRAFQRAYLLCATNDPDQVLPLGDGERARDLAEAARSHIEMLTRINGISENTHAI